MKMMLMIMTGDVIVNEIHQMISEQLNLMMLMMQSIDDDDDDDDDYQHTCNIPVTITYSMEPSPLL